MNSNMQLIKVAKRSNRFLYVQYTSSTPTHTRTHISPFSQSTDREYLFPNSCRNSQIPYGIVAHEQFSLSISHANL